MNIFDHLCVIHSQLDKAQLELLQRRQELKSLRDNARLAQSRKNELTDVINKLGIDRDEIISSLVKIVKLKDQVFEENQK